MTEGPGHPRGSVKARAAFYREKAAVLAQPRRLVLDGPERR